MDARCRVLLALLLGLSVQQPMAANRDFDGDGHDDVAWRNATTGADAWWRSGEPAWGGRLTSVANLQWKIVAIDDFDGDGRADLFWRNEQDGRNAIWRRANASMPLRVVTVADAQWQVLGSGDFDGDHRADLLWHHPGHGYVIWPAATGATGFRLSPLNFVAIADINGDGRDDIVGREPFLFPGGLLYFAWLGANERAKINLGLADIFVIADWHVQGMGDFNNDGRMDLFVRNVVDGRNAVWRGGNLNQETTLARIPDLGWNVVATGDYDGDGQTDLFWRHRVTGDAAVWPKGDRRLARVLAHVSTQWVVVP